MEGSHLKPGVGAADKSRSPFSQFSGGFVGEGDGKDAPRGDALYGGKVSDAVRHDARFTGAGSGHNEERAFGVLNGLFLSAAEFRKYLDLGSHNRIVAISLPSTVCDRHCLGRM